MTGLLSATVNMIGDCAKDAVAGVCVIDKAIRIKSFLI
jgi:hypothetical protein